MTISRPASLEAAGPAGAERQRQIAAEQVALLYSQGFASQLVAVINVSLTALVFWRVTPRATLLVWVALMGLIALARALLTAAYRRAADRQRDPRRWRRHYWRAPRLLRGPFWTKG